MGQAEIKGATGANPLDEKMTPAQIARRKFKAKLPRKVPVDRQLSALEAIAGVFSWLSIFREIVTDHGLSEDTVEAGLVYCQPGSSEMASTIDVPNDRKVGAFADRVLALDKPSFLGMIFTQIDPDAPSLAYKAVCFVGQFAGGPEAEARLLFARKKYLSDEKRMERLLRRR